MGMEFSELILSTQLQWSLWVRIQVIRDWKESSGKKMEAEGGAASSRNLAVKERKKYIIWEERRG